MLTYKQFKSSIKECKYQTMCNLQQTTKQKNNKNGVTSINKQKRKKHTLFTFIKHTKSENYML